MQLQELLATIPGITVSGDNRTEILGIRYDSRQINPGELFVAWKGAKADGTRFIQDAIARGAAAIAADRDIGHWPGVPFLRVQDARKFLAEAARVLFEDPAAHLKIAAITGTNGKTTTSYLVDAIFRASGLQSCVVGTLGMKIGDQPFPSAHTTPEASDLLAFLQQARKTGCTHGAMEVSSHALVQKRVFGVHFTTGVFSNLTPEHLDFHGDMESYYAAKRLLFTPEDGNAVQTAVINTDDIYGCKLAGEVRMPVIRYGFGAEADLHVLQSETGIEGTNVHLGTSAGEIEIHTRLVGRPNIYNIMAAAGAALSLGIAPSAIRKGIESLHGIPGRLEAVRAGQGFAVFVDYAHTPDALEKLLEIVRPLASARIITVFGCGGDRDRQKRPLMGAIAARLSQLVIATSDNPRSEDPLHILSEIEPGLMEGPAPFQIVPDRRSAIRIAISEAHAGDVVVIAGKGHEDYQLIGNQTLPFDDRAVARELIHQRMNVQGEECRGELHQ